MEIAAELIDELEYELDSLRAFLQLHIKDIRKVTMKMSTEEFLSSKEYLLNALFMNVNDSITNHLRFLEITRQAVAGEYDHAEGD